MCFHGVSTNITVLFQAFVWINGIRFTGEWGNFYLLSEERFLEEPGANGQNALQSAVSNPTSRRFRPGVCPAAGSSSWNRLNVSLHKVLGQCLKFLLRIMVSEQIRCAGDLNYIRADPSLFINPYLWFHALALCA
jgi:hypothetical protein